MNRCGIRWIRSLGIILVLVGPASAADFVRGDANDDGQVGLSDAWFILQYVLHGGPASKCLASSDVNKDGVVDMADPMSLLSHFLHYPGPYFGIPEPFPDPGPGAPGDLPCDSYGNGSPRMDPEARLEILNASAGGGGSRAATLQVRVSCSVPIAGYRFGIFSREGILDLPYPKGTQASSLIPGAPAEDGVLKALTYHDLSHFADPPIWCEVGQVNSLNSVFLIGPGQEIPLVEIDFCMQPGTKAGEYRIAFLTGELIAEDGRAIIPALVDGSLEVSRDVSWRAECPLSTDNSSCIHFDFELEHVSAAPGQTVSVPFWFWSPRPVTGFSYAIDFDEELIEAVGQRRIWEKPDGAPFEFESYEFDNRNNEPGSAGYEEGYLIGSAIISPDETGGFLPVQQEVKLLEFDLRLKDGVPLGSTTELCFRSTMEVPVSNTVTVYGTSWPGDGRPGSCGLRDGSIAIVSGPGVFIRGDSNSDGRVDISDAMAILGFLFLGGRPPDCLDAADANDDGTIDVSDAVRVLGYLFLGSEILPPPRETPDADPTPDSLGC